MRLEFTVTDGKKDEDNREKESNQQSDINARKILLICLMATK